MAEFIPVSDDYLEQCPALYGVLVPYQVGLPCRRSYRQPIELTPADLMTDIAGFNTLKRLREQRGQR